MKPAPEASPQVFCSHGPLRTPPLPNQNHPLPCCRCSTRKPPPLSKPHCTAIFVNICMSASTEPAAAAQVAATDVDDQSDTIAPLHKAAYFDPATIVGCPPQSWVSFFHCSATRFSQFVSAGRLLAFNGHRAADSNAHGAAGSGRKWGPAPVPTRRSNDSHHPRAGFPHIVSDPLFSFL